MSELKSETIGGDVETLRLIQHTAVRASGAVDKLQIIDVPGPVPRKLAVKPDGSYVELPVDTPDRNHSVLSIQSFCDYVLGAAEVGFSPTVWVAAETDHVGLITVLDDGPEDRRRHSCSCRIPSTAEFDSLVSIDQSPMDPKTFVRRLRNELGACLETPSGKQLMAAVRVLKFAGGTVAEHVNKRDRESLGRSIDAAIEAEAGPVPETVTLAVPLYDDPWIDTPRPLECLVDTLPVENRVQLVIRPDALRRAIRDVVAEVVGRIDKELSNSTPIYRGRP